MTPRLLIFLDALLDTRLGTLAKINLEGAKGLDLDAYRRRLSDEFSYLFPGFNEEEYREAYKNRNVETLMYSRPTLLSFGIGLMVEGMERGQTVNTVSGGAVEIDINFWPYSVTDDEKTLILQSIAARTGILSPLNSVFFPPPALTTEFIKRSDWGLIVLYDLDEWFRAVFTPDKLPVLIPDVTLMAPALVRSVEEAKSIRSKLEGCDPRLYDKTGSSPVDPFDELRKIMAPVVGLELISVYDFSLFHAKDLQIAS